MPTRGRPRRYDPDRALDAALAVFWAHGYQGSTLDALCAAMGMNRPSVYAAFGDKRRLFEQALARFGARLAEHGRTALAAPDLADALGALFAGVIPLYVPDGRPRGCLVYGVAAVDAPEDAVIGAFVADAVGGLDGLLRARFAQAVADGHLAPDDDPDGRARLAAAVVHSLSLRARAGEDAAALGAFAASSAALLAQGRGGALPVKSLK